jgi:hypothetical protein
MLRKWHHKWFGKAKNQPVRLRPRVRLSLETLEERAVPATFTVTSTADDGSSGTLRYAISQANASSDATNTINFNLPSGPQTIVLTQGALVLSNSHPTTILGTGANQLFISGNHTTTVFSISSGATVALDNLTIENGSGFEGGGIYNSGNLSINDSTLADNTANSYGGAIYNYNATASINNSILNGNTASYSGGGIYNYNATATITNSTLSNNRAGFYGGGIYNYDNATATISNSTLAYNAANIMGGGGIYNTFLGTVHVNNSTLVGNTGSYGGGIYNNSQGTLTVNDSTLADNTANNYGGGIYNSGTSATLGNSILAGNIAGNDPDVVGPFDSLGHNLIGIVNGGSGFNDDLVGSLASPLNPMLGSLANNGGPTQTMALLLGSPAIDAGSDALVPIDPSTGQPYATDQRGSGYFRISGPSVDIGAYEYPQQSPQTITFNPLPNEIYGDADFALTATASSGLPVSYSATGNATVHQDNHGNWFAHLAGVGTATITASQAGNSNYFAAPNNSESFTIAQATPTVPTPNVPTSAVYNGQPQGATVADVTGVNGTDLGAPTLTYYAGTYTLANLPSSGGSSTVPTGAGNYTVVATYAGSTDYSSASSLATYSISPLAVTLSGSRGYDGTATANASLLSVSNLVSGDHLSLSGSAGLAGADAGTETITDVSGLSLSGPSLGNYTLVGATGTLTIGQATPTVPTPVVPSNAVYNGQPHGATVGDVTGVNKTDLGAPTLTYYAGTYTLANLPSSGGSSSAPTNAGNYTVVASYAGSTDYIAARSLATYSISTGQATTAFHHLTVKQITLGTKTVSISGQLTSNTIVPAGQRVSITINGVTHVARVGPNGYFSVSFATGHLKAGAYTISYIYGGDSNFTATSGTGSLTVDYGTRLLFNNHRPDHSGTVLPIKLALTNARGSDVSSRCIAVRAVALKDSHGNPVSLKSAGNANPNNLFRYDRCQGGYSFDLDTKGLKAGTYTFSYKAGNDPTLHSLTFVVHDHHCRSHRHGHKGIVA